MGTTFAFGWEIPFMETVQKIGGSAMLTLAKFFTLFGEDLLLLAVVGIFYWGFNKEWGKYIGLNFMTGLLCGCMLKNVFLRRRPYMDHKTIQCLRLPTPDADPLDVAAQGFSFPSLHALDGMSIYGSLFTLVKKSWQKFLCVFLLAALGISRIYIGVHYPTDVLTGWIIGILAIIVVSWLQRKINRLLLAAIIAVAALPGWFFCTTTDFYSAYGLILGMIASIYVEEKFVKFENTTNLFRVVLRTIGGVTVFAVISTLLKLPFSKETLESITFTAHLLRALRYGIGVFAALGLYPIVFR